jgi:hypothetical protein
MSEVPFFHAVAQNSIRLAQLCIHVSTLIYIQRSMITNNGQETGICVLLLLLLLLLYYITHYITLTLYYIIAKLKPFSQFQ